MKILSEGQTDVGRARKRNEDSFLCRADLGLFAVCDEMGGLSAGAVASQTAIKVIETCFDSKSAELKEVETDSEGLKQLVPWVRDAIAKASEAVYEIASSQAGRGGMGTTATVVLIKGTKGIMGHVGDSRLYLHRGKELFQLSEDHSYIAALLGSGLINDDEAKDHPYRNMLTKAVGLQASVEMDTLIFDIIPDDSYLLCSDGLSRYFDDDSSPLLDVFNNTQPNLLDKLPSRLIKLANERGGEDNISVVFLHAEAEAETATEEKARGSQLNLCFDTLKEIPLFKGFSMKELVHLVERFSLETFNPGKTVIQEGEKGSNLYIILKGELQVLKGGMGLKTLGPGEHFGEMSLINARTRSASVTTFSKTRLLVMERERFLELLRSERELGGKLLWNLAQILTLRLSDTTDLLGHS